ncbi:flap endonuclease 1-like [Eriocheir sinensis]|uniref:flap endonuclease 1-like n=1 Tax=Eriocheir sinensis TaxID=95602 RepID=UPI0021C827AB|nr:flap endonuclease 1-like [Eriocheir sinensis]
MVGALSRRLFTFRGGLLPVLLPALQLHAAMGITGLSKLIADVAPAAVKENEMKNYFGRKVAVDASMSLYQFLVAVRQEGQMLTTADGETTSHLMGFFYRTIRMVDNGIKPVYVFDGKPPTMKGGELAKRKERRDEAQKALEQAEEAGNVEDVEKFSRRLVKVTKTHTEEAKKLLELMGIPYVEAPCEAEAQCAALAKAGKVYGVATEDMDALTFGTPILLRHMTFSEARKMPIKEFHLSKVLDGLELSQEEFIDLCILLGCDYCDSIKGVGPKRAIELIRQHRKIDAVVKQLDGKKYPVPEEWPFSQARQLFVEPEVADPKEIELKWNEPDEEKLVDYMCGEKGFSEERIRNGVKKLVKARNASTQGRLDSFFKVLPSPKTNGTNNNKRKAEEKAGSTKKTRGGGGKGKFSKGR